MNLSASLLNTRHVKHVLARAMVCGMLLALPSCGIPPLRPPTPAPKLPPDYNGAATPDNSARLGIDDFFTDPLLRNLIYQALAGNRELRALDEEARIAGNEVLARRGAYLPFISFGARAELEKHSDFTPLGAVVKEVEYLPGKHFPDPLPDFAFGLNLFWEPDIWRAMRNARDAAWQRYVAAIERRNDFATRLVAEVAETYYRLLALDMRMATLDKTIELQEQSLQVAQARKEAGRDTELPVQRFQADVRRNQSEKLIVRQEIIEAENRINFLSNRYPQPVERSSADFLDVNVPMLNVGVPAELLLNRPDIRQAERELQAAGLEVKVARADFFPRLDITGGVGYEAFNLKYLFWTPEALTYRIAGELVAPLINRYAIKAQYLSANARQLESLYNYQRIILDAFTEVVNRLAMVENYRRSIEIKKQQLESLVASVDVARKLFQAARGEYGDVLFSLRDLMEARMVLITTKERQLSAVVNAYRALGGPNGGRPLCPPKPNPPPPPPNPATAPDAPRQLPETQPEELPPPRLPMSISLEPFVDQFASDRPEPPAAKAAPGSARGPR